MWGMTSGIHLKMAPYSSVHQSLIYYAKYPVMPLNGVVAVNAIFSEYLN